MRTDTKMTKSAGEHWVCSVLAGLGWAASLTRDGLARTDLLAINVDSGRQVSVQVKTSSWGPRPNWIFGGKGTEAARTSGEWYVLVVLPSCPWDSPRGLVVPRDHVAAGFHISYTDWMTDPSVPQGSRRTTIVQARTGLWTFAGYEDRWDLLGTPSENVPVLLPTHYRQLAQDPRVSLPSGHPWATKLPEW